MSESAMLSEPVMSPEPDVSEPLKTSNPIKITVLRNGSLLVEGPIELCDCDGRPWDLTGKTKLHLCRCGASGNRPFCDGSHKKIGFQDAASPVPAA